MLYIYSEGYRQRTKSIWEPGTKRCYQVTIANGRIVNLAREYL